MSLKFSKISPMPKHIIHKYCDKIPIALLRLWEEEGLGYLLNGYLQVINPDDYIEFIRGTYFRGEFSIPIFITAFGDIITLEEQKYLRIIRYKNGDFISILENMHYFLEDLEDKGLWEDYFEIPLYEAALLRLGYLNDNQCFGFSPLLALGGERNVKHLEKVSIVEHLSILTQLTGGVGFD